MIKIRNNRFKIFVCLAVLLGGFLCSAYSPILSYAETADEAAKDVKYTQHPVDCSDEAKAKRAALYATYGFGLYNPCSLECSEGSDSSSTLPGGDNKEKIWNYLVSPEQGGLSPEQAAGILGNIEVESAGTFSPTVQEEDEDFPEGGYGIILQWKGERRTNLVTYLQSKVPELMEKYYNTNYSSVGSYSAASRGFVPKSIETGDYMSFEDNDALLKAELDFLVDESKSRDLNEAAVDKNYGTSSDKEWEVLKKQTTVEDVSNVWMYSNEFPDDAETAADDRIERGKAVFTAYSNTTEDSGSDSETAGCRIGGSGRAVHPIANGTLVNEGYGGPRPTPAGVVKCGGIRWHNGYDLNSINNVTPVLSSMDGTVTAIDYKYVNLNTVSIRNADGFTIRYMHMNNGYIDVKVGDEVTSGQVIGKAGNGNNNYGAHLHVEIDVTGNTNPEVAKLKVNVCSNIQSVNPNDFFKIFGVTLYPDGGRDNPRTAL